ncbi:gamma-glutamyl-gamma-aminobutyrate hydrolase family protein [Alphaproteobacteria bacterium LSUCC0684]
MIRLCVLQAGENNPKIPDEIPKYEEMFRTLFAPARELELSFVQVRLGKFPEDIDAWDAYLVTGSAAGVYDDLDWIAPLKKLIREIHAKRKPLVGICFGHQIIAEALGGKAIKSPKGWGVGVRSMPMHNVPSYFGDQNECLTLLYMHQDQVIKAPEGAQVFAGDAFCPIGGFTIGDTVLCLQGHPEFTPELVGAILDIRKDIIASDRITEGRESLQLPHNGHQIGIGIARFISKSARVETSSPSIHA